MKLMTRDLEKKFEHYDFGSQKGRGKDATVVVEYFNPLGSGTWLVVEGEKQPDGDWLLFGYFHIFEWEWGYVSLKELEDIRLPLGLGIERELHCDSCTVNDLIF